MTTTKQIKHTESGKILIPQAKWCDSFSAKLRGFTFRKELGESDGLVLVEKSDNRVNTAIHMLFVPFDLGVIWVNNTGEVVDTIIAKPWKLSYVPKAPCRYVIEGHPKRLQEVKVGDHIEFL